MIKLGRNDGCWCGSGKKYKACHEAFDAKIVKYAREGHIVPSHTIIKTPSQIEKIKESCKINIAVLDEIEVHYKKYSIPEEVYEIPILRHLSHCDGNDRLVASRLHWFFEYSR